MTSRQSTGLLMSTRQLTGLSLGMYDFDNDGWKDLFFALAHLMQLDRYIGSKAALPNRVYRSLEGKRLEDVSPGAGPDLQNAALHRGAVFADFDNDGRIDVAVAEMDAPVSLLMNRTPEPGHWIMLKLEGRANRFGVGARVTVKTSRGTQTREAKAGGSYASSNDPRLHFGLGAESTVQQITIRWPSGRMSTLEAVKAGQILAVAEPNQ